jgi:hypothetical protein
MSENDEQIDKKIVWQSHIHNAKEQLIELEKARIKFNEGQNKSREKIIKELALALEDNGMPTGLISEEIIRALADEGYGVTKQYINRCLDKKYKTKLQDNKLEEPETSFQNDGKNVPEQRALAVDASTGQEEEAPFKDIKRSDVIQEPERVKELEKRIDELEIENEVVKRENKILKEKTQPELFKELQEKFHDEPGILDANKLHKVSESVGKELVILLGHYNSILKDAVESGQPVPFGTYIMTKPEKKLVPVRVLINFDRRTIKIELWQKKLQVLNAQQVATKV